MLKPQHASAAALAYLPSTYAAPLDDDVHNVDFLGCQPRTKTKWQR